MAEKFTEEQYLEIVETQKNHFPDNVMGRGSNTEHFADSLSDKIYSFTVGSNLENELMALANPLTREWAHDKFVEKEKRYIWTANKKDRDGDISNLVKTNTGRIEFTYARGTKLTEREIREWGYNPDMFDREEVEC